MSDTADPTGDARLILPADGAQVVEVVGADRLTHLDATTTQALSDAAPGTATGTLVLDANGNPRAMFDVLVLPDRLWLITPDADVTTVVMDVIAGRTFLADARFTPRDHHVVRADVPGDLARAAFSGVTVVPEAGTVRTTPSGDVAVAADATGLLLVTGPRAEVDVLVGRLRDAGAADADPAAADAWAARTGRPAWGREVVPPHLPEEAGLLPTHVHLAKGCYPGQEAVARMWMLGRPRRRLARVRLTGDADTLAGVAPGWRAGEGRHAIEVTRIATGGDALAYVPGASATGSHLEVDGVDVEVLALVGDDPTPPGHDPAMRRRRDRQSAQES